MMSNISLEDEQVRQSTNSWTIPGETVRVPVTLSWENISYSIKVPDGGKCSRKKTTKRILQDVSGIVKPGQLLAIIGSTGAGKSTLLDVLAQRKNMSQVKGRILVNGRTPDKGFKRLSAYVTQDDALSGFLTVRETLQFYADLKLPSTISKDVRADRVNEVLDILGLEKVAESRVGTQFRRGISGGEKKRLSIGSQLITDPGILFLDEPTTGLDAYNSLSVIETMNRLCSRGRTIICTIHQPRSTIYELFDQLMVLSQGRTVYFGPASEAPNYFASLGFSCGTFINPADHFIDVTVMNEPALLPSQERSPLLDSKAPESFVNFPKLYAESEASKLVTQEIVKSNESVGKFEEPRKTKEYATGFFRQFVKLSQRSWRNVVRNPMVTYAQLGQTIFMALLMGTIYFQMQLDQGSIQDRVGALFFVSTNQAFAMLSALNLLLEERELYNREVAGGTYRTSAYFLAKSVVDAPLFLVFPLIFGTIVYWMVGFQPVGDCFGVFLLCLVTLAGVSGSLFMFLGSLSPSAVLAQILCPLTIVLFMLFGGFYVNVDNIPVYYYPVYYLSFFNYGFQNLCYNEFVGWGEDGYLVFECSDNPNAPCIQNGIQEMAVLGFEDVTEKTVWMNFGILWGMVIGYRVLAYLCLRFLYKEKR